MKWTVDRITGFILLSVCALFFLWLIPFYAESGPPSLMPKLSTAWIAVFSIWLIVTGARRPRCDRSDAQEAVLIDRADLGSKESPKLIFLMLLWGVHIALLPLLGFYLGSTIAVAASMRLLGKRDYTRILLWSTGAVFFLYVLFEKILLLRMPKGRMIEAVFSAIF